MTKDTVELVEKVGELILLTERKLSLLRELKRTLIWKRWTEEGMKQVTINHFLTDREIGQAARLYGRVDNFAEEVRKRIIEPNIERINRELGQENEPRFLAYVVEYVMMEEERRRNEARTGN